MAHIVFGRVQSSAASFEGEIEKDYFSCIAKKFSALLLLLVFCCPLWFFSPWKIKGLLCVVDAGELGNALLFWVEKEELLPLRITC